jgi:hypothetical protein
MNSTSEINLTSNENTFSPPLSFSRQYSLSPNTLNYSSENFTLPSRIINEENSTISSSNQSSIYFLFLDVGTVNNFISTPAINGSKIIIYINR